MVAKGAEGAHRSRKYAGVLQALRMVMREEGVRSLWKVSLAYLFVSLLIARSLCKSVLTRPHTPGKLDCRAAVGRIHGHAVFRLPGVPG